jgi:hypothetical protein
LITVLQGCSSSPAKTFQPELTGPGVSPFARSYNVTSTDACEAARRAMLSQGYTTRLLTPDTVDASKEYQPSNESHVSVSFHVVCTPGESSSSTSTVYVNAVQDNYALKKSDTSASVGLSVIGSVSLPFRQSNDSMVKISSETIPAGMFYNRFFDLLDRYLKTVVRALPIGGATVISENLPSLPSPVPLGLSKPTGPVTTDGIPSSTVNVSPVNEPPAPLLGLPDAVNAAPAGTSAPASGPSATIAPAPAAKVVGAAPAPAPAPAPAAAPVASPAANPTATQTVAHPTAVGSVNTAAASTAASGVAATPSVAALAGPATAVNARAAAAAP